MSEKGEVMLADTGSNPVPGWVTPTPRQSGSGHLVVLDIVTGRCRAGEQGTPLEVNRYGRGECESALKLHHIWEGDRTVPHAKVRTGLGKSDRPGS
jgi:hypothetical protein